MTNDFLLNFFFCSLHKIFTLFSKKYLLSNFLPRGHTEFFDLTHFGNARPSIFILHWNFELNNSLEVFLSRWSCHVTRYRWRIIASFCTKFCIPRIIATTPWKFPRKTASQIIKWPTYIEIKLRHCRFCHSRFSRW